MTFSIVIPTRLRASALLRTLDAISNQTIRDFEVIVVCDGPDSETERLVSARDFEYRLELIVSPARQGAAGARNLGADAARGDYLLFLDDDTIPVPGWLAAHSKELGAAGPRSRVVMGSVIDVFEREPNSECERLLRKQRRDSAIELEQTAASFSQRCFGVNCSIRRSVFLEAGGFDSRLSESNEDMELGSRFYDLGIGTVYSSEATVHHHDSKDLVDYCAMCWRAAGPIDLYRAVEKKQCNPQTRGVTYTSTGVLRRWKALLAWYAPGFVGVFESICRAITETTGASAFFRLWSAAAFSREYWQGIRAEGQALDTLRGLTGPPVRIVAMHGVFNPPDREARKYHVSPAHFRRVIRSLSAHYRFVTPEEALSGNCPNPLVLTFDDGYEDFYTEVFPHLSPLGIRPLVFVVADQIGGYNRWDHDCGIPKRQLLTRDQITELHRHGVQFGSHSLSHASLTRLNDDDLRREVTDSKSRLEDLLGDEVSCFAYPFGDVDSRVRTAVAEAGYRFAFTVNPGLNLWEDRLALKRIEVSERDRFPMLRVKVATGRNVLQEASNATQRLNRLSSWSGQIG